MTDSTVDATQDVVPLLERVLASKAFAPDNRAALALVLLRFHRYAHLPVEIKDEEFQTVMRAPTVTHALIARRWLEACGMIDRFEIPNGDNYFVPQFFGITNYIKAWEEAYAPSRKAVAYGGV